MAAKVIWSDPARDDLDAIFLGLYSFSENYANSWIEKLFLDVDRLETFPEMGRIVPEKEVSFLREIIVWKYRVFYIYFDNEVRIVRLQHSSKPLGKI
jgi:plasmid stabilization system protein ParE